MRIHIPDELARGPGFILQSLVVETMSPHYPEWLNDPETSRYLVGEPTVHTQQTCAKYVDDCLSDPSTLLLGIRMDGGGDSQHVGNVKFSAIRPIHGTAEIGILIGDRSLWGRGLGYHVLTSAKAIAKMSLGLRKLTAGILMPNVGSQLAFERAGFTQLGARSKQFLLEGSPEDEILTECFL